MVEDDFPRLFGTKTVTTMIVQTIVRSFLYGRGVRLLPATVPYLAIRRLSLKDRN